MESQKNNSLKCELGDRGVCVPVQSPFKGVSMEFLEEEVVSDVDNIKRGLVILYLRLLQEGLELSEIELINREVMQEVLE